MKNVRSFHAPHAASAGGCVARKGSGTSGTHGFPALAPMGGSARAAWGTRPHVLAPSTLLTRPGPAPEVATRMETRKPGSFSSPWDRCCFGAGKTPLAPGRSAWGTFTCTRTAPAQGKSSTHPVGQEFPCWFWGHCLGGCKTWWLHGWTRWETQICGCADVPPPARPH